MAPSRVLVGVTGSIAAFKACDLVSRLRNQGIEVRVIMTNNATRFVSPLTFETLSGNTVHVDSFEARDGQTQHIELARWAQLCCIAPASASAISKLAWGIADNLLTTELLAFEGPVLIAPAMNHSMYRSQQMTRAIERLEDMSYILIDPEIGPLACGETGVGRLASVDRIFTEIDAKLLSINSPNWFKGRRFLITSGPTVSPIDPIRYITNPSTGKMGVAIARAAMAFGAEVTLIQGGNGSVPAVGKVVKVRTTEDMYDAVMDNIKDHDVFIGAGAPCDFQIQQFPEKIKKLDGNLQLSLKPTQDIISSVANSEHRPEYVIGFAAETTNHLEFAQDKLVRKQLDCIVLNHIGDDNMAFGGDDNEVTIINRTGDIFEIPKQSKQDVAIHLMEFLHEHLFDQSGVEKAPIRIQR